MITTLAALVDDLCASDDVDWFTRRWGRAEPSRARDPGVRVVCAPDCPFEALEVRPWGDDVTGLVDVEFRTGRPGLGWAAVRNRFGPFRDLPRRHPSAPQFGGTTTGATGSPADAFLVVTVAGDTVVDLCVRRDPR
ncbi:MAG TPA: hypothetical protein VF244_11145 [Acidimicrobiales bacterium]